MIGSFMKLRRRSPKPWSKSSNHWRPWSHGPKKSLSQCWSSPPCQGVCQAGTAIPIERNHCCNLTVQVIQSQNGQRWKFQPNWHGNLDKCMAWNEWYNLAHTCPMAEKRTKVAIRKCSSSNPAAESLLLITTEYQWHDSDFDDMKAPLLWSKPVYHRWPGRHNPS